MPYTSVLYFLGWLILAFAAFLAAPLVTALVLGEAAAAGGFLAAMVLSGFAGGACVLGLRGTKRRDTTRQWFLLPVLAWTVLPALGAVPFYFAGAVANWGDAYFEAASGLTTTGFTVLTGLDGIARSVLLWRALLQWMGGFGTLVLAITLLSLLGIGGMQLFRSLMPRGEGESMFLRMRRVTVPVFRIYATLTAACGILLWVAGMPAFDALCHALSTLSTGGFSTRDGSVGAFGNPLAEIVLMVFMVAGALNFTLYWAAARRHRRVYRDDTEARYFLAIVLMGTVLVAAGLLADDGSALAGAMAVESAPGFAANLRAALFGVVSAITTTGYSSGATVPLPMFPAMVLMGLILIGGCSGSTSGGLKLMRLSLLLSQSRRELARLAHPHGVIRLSYSDQTVTEPIMAGAWAFFVIYILSVALTTLAVAATGPELYGAMSLAAAAISNAGPAADLLGTTAPRDLSAGAKWILCAAMAFGRLEIFAVLTLINPAYWRR